MMHPFTKMLVLASAIAAAALGCTQAGAANAELDCKLHFTLTGWSAIYKHAEGNGVVKCEDGSSMRVDITSKGGGLTVGKSRIDSGTGKFSDVRTIDDVLGRYAQGEVHAGVVKSGTVQVLTKGPVSLALAGNGEGMDLGIAIGELTLTRAHR